MKSSITKIREAGHANLAAFLEELVAKGYRIQPKDQPYETYAGWIYTQDGRCLAGFRYLPDLLVFGHSLNFPKSAQTMEELKMALDEIFELARKHHLPTRERIQETAP